MSAGDPQGRDRPLMQWGEELRRRKADRRKLRLRMAGGAALTTLVLASAAFHPAPRLVWNASASVPIGLYVVRAPASLQRGDMVIARLAPRPARMAASRGYLPLGVPLVKPIAGLPGDRICARGAIISVNGAPIATRLSADARGRRLPLWRGCRTLGPTQLLLLNASVARSFDGRYFGPSERSDILGEAVPIWLR